MRGAAHGQESLTADPAQANWASEMLDSFLGTVLFPGFSPTALNVAYQEFSIQARRSGILSSSSKWLDFASWSTRIAPLTCFHRDDEQSAKCVLQKTNRISRQGGFP